MKTAGNRITSSILSIPQDGSINNAAEIIYTEVGSLLVTYNNNFIGVITKIDLILKVLTNNLNSESTRVAEVMSQLLISISLMNLPEKSSRYLTVTLPQRSCRNLIYKRPVIKSVFLYNLFYCTVQSSAGKPYFYIISRINALRIFQRLFIFRTNAIPSF